MGRKTANDPHPQQTSPPGSMSKQLTSDNSDRTPANDPHAKQPLTPKFVSRQAKTAK